MVISFADQFHVPINFLCRWVQVSEFLDRSVCSKKIWENLVRKYERQALRQCKADKTLLQFIFDWFLPRRSWLIFIAFIFAVKCALFSVHWPRIFALCLLHILISLVWSYKWLFISSLCLQIWFQEDFNWIYAHTSCFFLNVWSIGFLPEVLFLMRTLIWTVARVYSIVSTTSASHQISLLAIHSSVCIYWYSRHISYLHVKCSLELHCKVFGASIARHV
jgi:hypothetical protein